MGPVALITGCIWTFLLHPFSVPTTLLGTFLFTLLVFNSIAPIGVHIPFQ